MKIIFMGTPEFAVPTLEKLTEKHEVIAVFTQPDKPKGRGQKMQFTPVKEFAIKKNIKVYQPERLKNNSEVENLIKELNADAIVVVAYGQILPKSILEAPRLGSINVHASLLPKLRGAAPINWAIINGESKTGITTMLMDVGLDTGDMLLKKEVEILENQTAGELHDNLMLIGADLLIETLEGLEKGIIIPEKQDDKFSSYAPMLSKEMGHINWDRNFEEIHNLIRGLIPWPGAYSYYEDQMIKIWKSRKKNNAVCGKPGEIIEITKNGIEVACKEGSIEILELQEVGGKKMDVASYLNGHKLEKGKILK
ncbi:Methionyl-tRNA formyltransferase [Caloramator mitchellensis]|uniref:Methionyl-tRNA formyltransferase n=1 Tax=Caloramator mitchellensis TaxID=908809 RepID=A0A0R3JX42_CALMK|nr:methionyl-tRNA formyltransferase [Caloramator mitchellensis]KRQ86925.1 Methionyl-tRNA formyltransferase [Caloramator mitchellensis]